MGDDGHFFFLWPSIWAFLQLLGFLLFVFQSGFGNIVQFGRSFFLLCFRWGLNDCNHTFRPFGKSWLFPFRSQVEFIVILKKHSAGMFPKIHFQSPSSLLLLLYYKVKIIIPKILMKGKQICLFDVDGTLTKPRNPIQTTMLECLEKLKQKIDIGFVGGSDLHKIQSQLTAEGVKKGKYLFSENGLLALENGKVIGKEEIGKFFGEQKLQKFINFCLKYLSDLELPCKRGTFIEYRTGLINVSPIGRNCSQEERDEFQKYDHQNNIRKNMIEVLRKQFADMNLRYSIGGQISFDVFPSGWDKTYCLRYLKQYDEIYFFGDKTWQGGNDHELYELLKEKERSFSVKNFGETIKIIEEKFL